MRKTVYGLFFAVLGVLLLNIPIFAHHAASAEFDIKSSVTVTGAITKVDWINPHVYLYMDVTDNAGKHSTWTWETTNPGRLHIAGLSKTELGLGKTVTIQGYNAKDHTKAFSWLRTIKFEDGHSVLVWPTGADDSKP
jgi:hypothetical protein